MKKYYFSEKRKRTSIESYRYHGRLLAPSDGDTWNRPVGAAHSPYEYSLLFSRCQQTVKFFHVLIINTYITSILIYFTSIWLPNLTRKVEKKAVTGESSMAPPHRERHGPRQDTHSFIQTGSRLQREKVPGPYATCSAMSPKAAEKPRQIPVIWEGPDARHEGFAYNNPPQAHGLRPSPRFFSPTTGTSVMRTLQLPMATTHPALSCSTSAPPWHQPGVNSVPCRMSSGR
jgi:hypothetical protein